MSQSVPAYSARSASVGRIGRTLTTMRQHHIVIDSPSTGEEINSGEVFLAGVSSCGVTLIEGAARELGIRLERIEVSIDGYRVPGQPAFDHIDMGFRLVGPSQQEAAVLVGRYRDG